MIGIDTGGPQKVFSVKFEDSSHLKISQYAYIYVNLLLEHPRISLIAINEKTKRLCWNNITQLGKETEVMKKFQV